MSTESKSTALLQVQQGVVAPTAHCPRLYVLANEPRAAAPVLETSATAATPAIARTAAAAASRFLRRVILTLLGRLSSCRKGPIYGRDGHPDAWSTPCLHAGVAASAQRSTSHRHATRVKGEKGSSAAASWSALTGRGEGVALVHGLDRGRAAAAR